VSKHVLPWTFEIIFGNVIVSYNWLMVPAELPKPEVSSLSARQDFFLKHIHICPPPIVIVKHKLKYIHRVLQHCDPCLTASESLFLSVAFIFELHLVNNGL
jgi:hypothetical protein